MQEQDQSVLVLAVLLKRINKTPDSLIHTVEHCSIDFHAARLPFLVFDVAPIASLRRNLPARVEQANLLHLFKACGSDGVVASVVSAFDFCDVRFLGMHGPVRRGVSHIKKEWSVVVLLMMLGDELGCMVVDSIGVIELFWLVLGIRVRRD